MLITPRGRGEPVWQLGLRLTAWGSAHDPQQVDFAYAVAESNHVEYRRGPLTEWYVNTSMGLEQGFTIDAPPADNITELVLEMTIAGNLNAELGHGGNSVCFRREGSNELVSYSGLDARDAVDAHLDARVELRGGGTRVRLVVVVKDAAWPVSVESTAIHLAQLFPTPDLMKSNAGFGQSMAVDGDTLVVGISSREIGGATGAAHVFQRDQSGAGAWGHVAEIVAEDGQTYDYFGNAVDISGDTVVVGAYGNDDNGPVSGSGYVFQRDHGGPDAWGQVAKVLPADGAAEDFFGNSVAISGDSALIGAPSSYWAPTPAPGSAYIFHRGLRGPDAWGEVAKISGFDSAEDDEFGGSVAIENETCVVGARLNDSLGYNSGSAYVYRISDAFFADGFETGDTSEWSATVP